MHLLLSIMFGLFLFICVASIIPRDSMSNVNMGTAGIISTTDIPQYCGCCTTSFTFKSYETSKL